MTVKMEKAENKLFTRRNNRAFTLIEILCVVVILGICSALIIPQIGSRDDLRVAAAARVVMADLMYAQNRAISTQQKQFLSFSGQAYTLQYRTSDTAPLTTTTHPTTKGNYITGFSTSATNSALNSCTLVSWSMGSGINVLGFDELGAPFAYNTSSGVISSLTTAATIQLRCGTQTLTISIEPFTGETSVN